MNITGDIQAVLARIAQITGTTAAPAAVPQTGTPSFASMVAGAMQPQGSVTGTDGAPSQANAPLAPPQIDALAQSNGQLWGVDPNLLKAIMANESDFDPKATSRTGAQGLMQLEPGTAADLGVHDAYDPAQNVWGGARYMRGLLDRFGGNLRLAVAAYNAGPGAVEKYGDVPPYAETQTYVQNVLESYKKYQGG